ncbi:hypothetical protein Tco_0088066 [Tanacetum coccineum]
MSNSNTNLQTQSSNALHNAIMEAGSKDFHQFITRIILTGIDNEIYPQLMLIPNAFEMWKAIYRLKQGEFNQCFKIETNLIRNFWKIHITDGDHLKRILLFTRMMNELVRISVMLQNHQVNVQFLLQLQHMAKVVTLVKRVQELEAVSYHKLYDILKQHQNEVNEIRAERLARTVANHLHLFSTTTS